MKTDEIRKRFLDFFQRYDHALVASDSLVPKGDPSLLFTGSGMNQFKDEFYGRGRPLKRAVTCQKCLRTGDIEEVGKSYSHHTFFEMLGNFSFGDYFKLESIVWAWEFMLDEMGIPAEKMAVSIYEGDEESARIWREEIGLPPERIYRYGADDNFWPPNARTEGPNGPCGPCTEIYFDKGEEAGCGRPDCEPSCDCGRFIEVWNLVLQQFDRKEGGVLDPLPMQNIDTGMGLERMARVLQRVPTNFDIDIFEPLMAEVSEICGKPYVYDCPAASLMRRVADHARGVIFCIADGVMPSNEERGYVVRRLLRRAIRDAVQLGVHEPFFTRLVEPILSTHGESYPELIEHRDHIETVISREEEAFRKTVERGSTILDGHIANLRRTRASVLRGKEAFDLYQTYGFPVEMTESILKEQGMSIDMQGFLTEMQQHQKLSRETGTFGQELFGAGAASDLMGKREPTEFTGYRTLESETEVIGIVVDDGLVESLEVDQEGAVVLARTPAYAEAGGQLGDRGAILTEDGTRVEFAFESVRMEKGFHLHSGRMVRGRLHVGDRVVCRVDKANRLAIARNHTATHLLHYALRQVLGEHAKQSGSLVSHARLRFDFTNPTELSPDELRRTEDIVNERILADEPLAWTRMGLSEARDMGATALFGEKYGDIVRVVSIGEFSRELCGGTHCERTGQIGSFRIVSESSVAGGVRRIEAVTGLSVLDRLRGKEDQLRQLCEILNTQEPDLDRRAEELLGQIRSLQKNLTKQRQMAAQRMASGSLLDDADRIGDTRVVIAKLGGGSAELRSAADALRKGGEKTACVLASDEGGKVALVVGLSRDLVESGLSALKIVKEISKVVGGGGGGRDDLAQAGGSLVEKLPEALETAREIFRNILPGQ